MGKTTLHRGPDSELAGQTVAGPVLHSPHRIRTLPVLVLLPHSRCNCRCVMCDIWRIRQDRQLTWRDLEPHFDSIRRLGVRWVVFSGGEPQMNPELARLGAWFRSEGIRVTLLTAGLLLEPFAGSVVETVDDVIVSLDGPPDVHEAIRRVPRAFHRLARGVAAIRERRPAIEVRGRCTVQRLNHTRLRDTVHTARRIGLNSISFLAADATSQAFNRPQGWTIERQNDVMLSAEEVKALEAEVESLIRESREDISRGFVAESEEKLRRIVRHFRAHLGQCPPSAPFCNAPWVSAVVEADGTVRPCFFHRSLGNLHEGALADVLNGEPAIRFREQLDVSRHPICQRCVCSLYLPPKGRRGEAGEV
jgi:MoaA/NifB/PqqE/SkfB family radical SAM enzyme